MVIFAGCVSESTSDEDKQEQAAEVAPLVVYTVNYPLSFFAQRIGGSAVRVEFPAPPDVDPAFWSPDVDTIAAYQAADLILLNGATYAKWVDRVSLPPSKMVDTSAAFRDRYLAVTDATVHRHGPQGEHAHTSTAFTTWLDVSLAIEQARAVGQALAAARLEQANAFEARLQMLVAELQELDDELRRVTEGKSNAPLLASHPVYQYLARAYDLDLHSLHLEPDEMPSDADWVALRRLLTDHPANSMLWESEPLAATQRELEALGVRSLVFDPCAHRPAEGDFLSVMHSSVANLAAALSQ